METEEKRGPGRPSAPKTYKVRLLRNYFVKAGTKMKKGEIVELSKDEAQRLLTEFAAEKVDARVID